MLEVVWQGFLQLLYWSDVGRMRSIDSEGFCQIALIRFFFFWSGVMNDFYTLIWWVCQNEFFYSGIRSSFVEKTTVYIYTHKNRCKYQGEKIVGMRIACMTLCSESRSNKCLNFEEREYVNENICWRTIQTISVSVLCQWFVYVNISFYLACKLVRMIECCLYSTVEKFPFLCWTCRIVL